MLKLKEKTWDRMKTESEPTTKNAMDERPEIDVLTFDDMQAAFFMFLIMVVIDLCVATFESFAANKKH